MSIKIYTYYYTNNYGALLQSLCLKTFIQECTESKISYSRYQPKKLMFSEVYRPLITKNFSKFLGMMRRNINMKIWKNKINLEKPIYNKIEINDQKSLSVYGSDEIWNYDNAYHGYDDYFFGQSNTSIKISYAASFGRSKFENLSDFQKNEIASNLKKFKSISVRDTNSANIVKQLINISPSIVVDPTLLVTPKILENKKKLIISEGTNYVLVYGTVFSKEQKKMIKNFCEKNNYKLFSIGHMNKWVKYNLIHLDPTEFYQMVKNSKFVFTSMFHGIMFSVKLKKNFWYSVDPIRKNKINHFIKKLYLNNREIKDNINLDTKINYQEVYKILDPWIIESKNFLKKNIYENIK
jgi:hypothetical protein